MRDKLTTFLTVVIMMLILAVGITKAQGDPPETMTYQGHLLDAANTAVPDDTYSMGFELYDAETVGSSIWGPEALSVTTSSGYFSVLLGETEPITPGLLTTGTWLEVTVEGETMTPRHQFGSVPFALNASDVQEFTIGDLDCVDGQIAQWNATADVWQCGDAGSGGSGTDEMIARWGESNTLQDSGVAINDSNEITGVTSLEIAGVTPALEVIGDSLSTVGLVAFDDSTLASSLHFRKSRGSTSTPMIVQDNDSLGGIYFAGFDGASARGGARIQAVVDGTPGINDMPARLIFAVTPDGNPVSVPALTIENDGTFDFHGNELTNATITDTLGGLNCSTSQIAEWNGSAWVCATPTSGDITAVTAGSGLSGGGATGNVSLAVNWPAGVADGDDYAANTDTLGGLNCSTSQIAEWNGSAWVCATPESGGGDVSMPIGSIIAWHKSLSGVPALPDGWLECDGSVVADAASPLNGVTLPALNNDTQDGSTSSGMFLRGASTSGAMQEDATAVNGLEIRFTYSAAGTPARPQMGYDGSHVWISSGDDMRGDPETRPANMTVVWIMRIK